MHERDGYPPGVPCWVDTGQADPAAAAAFYGGLFGWDFADAPSRGATSYLLARLRGADVAAIASRTEEGATWNTYVRVESADEAVAKVSAAGGRVVAAPFDLAGAARVAWLEDREGAAFRVWQPEEHAGARIVNEPGSLNFNVLNTRDAAAAESFYGSVFGWKSLALADGARAWTLAGYGEHVAQSDPGLRARMAQAGVPPGFEDVIATLLPLGADQPHAPAHWSVTFAVADVDATAERATQLGGRVLVAPFDAPFVRMAQIADPQGATFVTSQFVPLAA
jgi:uncharacterized protein